MKHYIKTVAVIDAAVIAIVGLFSWLITRLEFGTSLIWAGLGLIVIGSMAALGGWSVAEGEYDLRFDQKFPQHKYERTSEKWNEMHKSYDFCLLMAASAIMPIAIGVLINYIAK